MNKQPAEKFLQSLTADFSRLREERGGIALFSTREHAMDRLKESTLPTQRLEAWKHTDPTPLYERDLRWKTEATDVSKQRLREWVSEYAPAGFEQKTVVLVDGIVEALFLEDIDDEILQVMSLRKAVENGIDAPRTSLIEEVVIENEASLALSAAASVFWQDGVYVSAKGKSVAQKLCVLHIVTPSSRGKHMHAKFLYDVNQSADLSVLERTVGIESSDVWVNSGRHVHLQKNANFEHVTLQEASRETIVTTNAYVSQAQDSNYRSVQCDVGGHLVRNNVTDRLREENCEGAFFGLYLPKDDQLIDNYTTFDHIAEHCLSRELYKGVLDGTARAVFNGRVIVRKQAQKTDAYQKNNNLLLSNKAKVNTKPQLEIYADDVQCTHGATIGQIEDEAVFYLQTRGLSEAQARRMLRFAFIGEVVEKIAYESFRGIVQTVAENELA